MKSEPDPEAVARILAENPDVDCLRIDKEKQEVEVGFAGRLPEESVLEHVDASLRREIPNPEVVMHLPETIHAPASQDGKTPFHHHHLGADVIEFHRGTTEPDDPVVWRRFKIPRWQNRPPPSGEAPDHRVMLLLAGLCGALAVSGYFAQQAHITWLACLAFGGAYGCGGWYALRELLGELRHGKIDVHFLMLLVAFGALFVSAWAEGATLLFLFSLSGGLEQLAHHRTQKTISSLLKTAPKHAFVRRGEAWAEVSTEEVQLGDELLIKPGELFPMDGVLVEGETSADESALTGESIPVRKSRGAHLSGGTLNLDGRAVMRVEKLPRDSAVQRIVTLIEDAQKQKAPAQRFTDAFGRYYTWAALSMSAGLFVFLWATHHPLREAFYRTMTLLVVASPCALVLSIPSAILVAIAAGARCGILFRGGLAVENLAGVNQFAFDKTGTLTKGHLQVARIEVVANASADEILQLAASVGQLSTHPLSRAIVDEAQRRGLGLVPVEAFQNLAGLGMEARLGARSVLVGSRALLTSRQLAISPQEHDGAFVEVWVADEKPLGVILLSDEIRAEARGTIEELRRAGAAITLLTGDRLVVADQIGHSLGIRDVRAGLAPADKLACIHGWQAAGKKVAMVGDGINDAPSLTAADVAIGMGSRGSDAALEQADIVLMHDKIENVAVALSISRRARAIIRQNLVISLGVVVLLIVSALSNRIGLSLGVVGHEGSTVIVVLNGLRLLRLGRNAPPVGS